ncbi:MAG: rhamnogalacturonan lyase [Paludibacter sp.]|nr:rhamnogalacturonan lyase [Paludibacter sp.]
MKKFLSFLFIIAFCSVSVGSLRADNRQMEYLNRGLVAVKVSNGVFLSWRLLGNDAKNIAFNIYKNKTTLVNSTPLTTVTNYADASGLLTDTYTIRPVLNNVEDLTESNSIVTPWQQQYKSIQLNRPANGRTTPNKYGSTGKAATGSYPQGQPYGYSPNDCSVGDVDGDGEYEIIVKWDPSNSQDNSYYGITGKVYLDAYKLDGTQLWRIDLGKNIRAGAHYTQFLVYDFDGDGLAELICKTAPGTIDGKGHNVIMNTDDPNADYRNIDTTQITGSRMLGTIQTGPEYLTLFDGKTGAELNTIAYNPLRGSSSWGDTYGNRSDRFLACVAYLDGVHPSAVMCRGYYTRACLAAFDVKDKKLVQRWFHDSGNTAGVGGFGQGNHNLSVGDVNGDGKDEIIYGSSAINNDGTLLYSTGLGHGDAMHVSDLDPDRPGLEVWDVHEDAASAYRWEMHDAATGSIVWGGNVAGDNGRGCSADIDARYRGFEMWSSLSTGTYSCKGVQISTSKPSADNFRVYWDGDLQDELLDGVKITKWTGSGTSTLLTASGVSSCNSTKATPNLSADILGDWREEVLLWETSDSSKLRIYTTTIPTTNRLYTLMHDPVYRLGIAWQNAAYNQPPHLGFYIGDGLDNVPQPTMYTPRYDPLAISDVQNISSQHAVIYKSGESVIINSSELIHSVSVYSLLGKLVLQLNGVERQEYNFKCPISEKVLVVKVNTDSGVQVAKIINY